MSLSDRIRPNCEAAAWVCEEVKQLERENAALREEVVKANGLLDMQMKELAKLREDKERLDWLSQGHSANYSSRVNGWDIDDRAIYGPMNLRASIDAARKENKP